MAAMSQCLWSSASRFTNGSMEDGSKGSIGCGTGCGTWLQFLLIFVSRSLQTPGTSTTAFRWVVARVDLGPWHCFRSNATVGITGECWRACVWESIQKAWDSAYMWMPKNNAATFRPPVHMLGHQTSHQSDHAHPLGRPGQNGGLPCRLSWRRMLKTSVWMNADDCSIMSWIWTWTLTISQSTAVEKQRDVLSLNAFWSRRSMTKHLSNSKCFQIVPPLVPKCFGDM